MRRKLTCCCRGGKVALAIHNCRKPVIAAINGSAVGVGITMTLPCAIRVTSASSRIGFVFARRGIVMEACSSYFLPKLIGYSRAMHLVSTGAVYPATSKLFDGLFCEVLDRTEDVLPRALEFASDISKNVSTVSWTLMRDLIWRGKDSAEETHLLDSQVLWALFGGKDNAEGVKSFLEKRQAKYEGTMERDAPYAWPWWNAVDVRQVELRKERRPAKL